MLLIFASMDLSINCLPELTKFSFHPKKHKKIITTSVEGKFYW